MTEESEVSPQESGEKKEEETAGEEETGVGDAWL